MVQIGCRGIARRLFENFKKFFLKITEFEFQNSGPSFLRLCLLCIVKKLDSIQTKLTEEIHFEICHSRNPPADRMVCARWKWTAAPACSSSRRAAPACSDRSSAGILNWGHSERLAFRTGGATGPWKPTGLFISWSVCHDHEPCKNGWTNGDGLWVVDSGRAILSTGNTVHVWWRCGLLSNYSDHLLLLYLLLLLNSQRCDHTWNWAYRGPRQCACRWHWSLPLLPRSHSVTAHCSVPTNNQLYSP